MSCSNCVLCGEYTLVCKCLIKWARFVFVAVVIIGNTPCSAVSKANGLHCNTFTAAEEETVMALWSLWSAPILMSNDLANIPVRHVCVCLPLALLVWDQLDLTM